ncbi:MAG: hypothetical protein MZW92_02175 [Comamonadaceae bacterium]|nr:hypothetical protein [Comamonadaceae bacterium]
MREDRPGVPSPDDRLALPPTSSGRPDHPGALGRERPSPDPGDGIRPRRHVRRPGPRDAGTGLSPGHVGLPSPALDLRGGGPPRPRDGRGPLRPGRCRGRRAARRPSSPRTTPKGAVADLACLFHDILDTADQPPFQPARTSSVSATPWPSTWSWPTTGSASASSARPAPRAARPFRILVTDPALRRRRRGRPSS